MLPNLIKASSSRSKRSSQAYYKGSEMGYGGGEFSDHPIYINDSLTQVKKRRRSREIKRAIVRTISYHLLYYMVFSFMIMRQV